MKDAQQAAEAYAKETMLSGKTPEEIAYIAFFAGTEWQRQKAALESCTDKQEERMEGIHLP